MAWRFFKYIQHLFYRKHRKGHGIHSPYVFEFVSQVVFNGDRIEVPTAIRDIHTALRNDSRMIPEGDRKIRSFVRGASVSRSYGALLFRIAGWLQPLMILELGTGLGVSTLYLASGVRGDQMSGSGSESGSEPQPVYVLRFELRNRSAFTLRIGSTGPLFRKNW